MISEKIFSLSIAAACALGATLSIPTQARADICSLPAKSLTRSQLLLILKDGCDPPASSHNAASRSTNNTNAPDNTSSADAGSLGDINVGIAGGAQTNSGGVNVGVGPNAASRNSSGINAGVGTDAASGNTGGINAGIGNGAASGNTGGLSVGVGSGTASGNTGGVSADVGGGGTGAGSNNTGGIGIGIGGQSGIGVNAGSKGVGASVGGVSGRR